MFELGVFPIFLDNYPLKNLQNPRVDFLRQEKTWTPVRIL